MQLIKIGVEAYTRFRSREELDVDAQLIALLGPNEAGKTSLLRALQQLNTDGAIPELDVSRGVEPDSTRVWARYVVDDTERAQMPDDAQGVRQLVVTKHFSGQLEYRFEPEIRRNQRRRERLVDAALATLEPVEAVTTLDDEQDEAEQQARRELAAWCDKTGQALIEVRSSDQDTIAASIVDAVQVAADEAAERELEDVSSALNEVATYERVHPFDQAAERASARRPSFVDFSGAHRELPDSRNLDDGPTAGLENMLAMGGSSWEELQAARGDRGRLVGLLKTVNRGINERLADWGQAPVEIELSVDGNILEVFVKTAIDDYIAFSRRSSGLRMFVALRAFVAQQSLPVRPILLIDEAEMHLHYDAQADLVRVLAEQEDAAGVIYSTHSAGCLPSDLGTGVRAVEPIFENGQPERSSLRSNFFETEHGLNPLTIALGARTFALTLRRALLVEGISDAILLPVLLRQVTGLQDLPFQVLPGISKAGAEHARSLEAAAGRVAYLLDADEAGQQKRAEMVNDWGIPADRIFLMPDAFDGLGSTTLEDVLEEAHYQAAVERQVAMWNDACDTDDLELPVRNRSGAVKEWAAAKGISVPGKAAVVARVLERRRDSQGEPTLLVADGFRLPLRELYSEIAAALEQKLPAGAADAAPDHDTPLL